MPSVERDRAVAVDLALSGQTHVGSLITVDERGIVVAFRPFPFGEHHGQVVVRIGRKFQTGAFFQVQVHVALQYHGAAHVVGSRRNEHGASAVFVARVDGRDEGGTAVVRRVGLGAVFCDVVNGVPEHRGRDVFQDFMHRVPAAFRGGGGSRTVATAENQHAAQEQPKGLFHETVTVGESSGFASAFCDGRTVKVTTLSPDSQKVPGTVLQRFLERKPHPSTRSVAEFTCRDILGHISVQTTEIYARVENIQKIEAIDRTSIDLLSDYEKPQWKDPDVLDWLKKL